MSKKNKGVEDEPLMFGRPSNHVKAGVVGLPNVGKSSLFNELCKQSIPAENYPFCTLDPNTSRCIVPDERFDYLCEQFEPGSKVPAYLTVTDIAGLVRNAHEGEGLGNAFLSHIGATDAIFHVVRVFQDDDIVHVDGSVDPVRDLATITRELRMKDVAALKQHVEAVSKKAQQEKELRKVVPVLEKALKHVEDGGLIRFGTWKNSEVDILNDYLLLTAKPVLYVINMTTKDYVRRKNKWLGKIKQWVDEHSGGEQIIPISVAFEQSLSDCSTDEERAAICKEKGAQSSLGKLIRAGYHNLKLVHYFTCGKDEVKAWTLRRNTKAPQAAGVIHTDFEKGFIKAEVMAYDDFKEHGSEKGVREAGRYRMEGKNYVVQDGDIIFFKFNAPSGGKKKK